MQRAAAADLPSAGRALVPLEAAEAAGGVHRVTPRRADFLAHLIATARHAPQTRERRRAEPREAVAAYAATLARR